MLEGELRSATRGQQMQNKGSTQQGLRRPMWQKVHVGEGVVERTPTKQLEVWAFGGVLGGATMLVGPSEDRRQAGRQDGSLSCSDI
eukprot:CAMPEP_0195031910 /NCGR_PEP_ID=MMETSP0326_2-20130528/62346_1 /TAXON_ID=2866 ORGANISM="Crypthecodinium cohnii, Strain Seligo" /NCGR_SAMPLE_ID=MMETSP0326_2 /ASSEMBLY_ACC=CAM_ASM_000348 /LENGTH=85 /DNA_ID=CAMNT_0040055829 /DNA_START=12 /DNA_END=270 /DNA_ORIENTATION=-